MRVYGKTPCNRSVNMVHFEEKAHYDLQDLRQIVHLLLATIRHTNTDATPSTDRCHAAAAASSGRAG